jgi:hypothetical protein
MFSIRAGTRLQKGIALCSLLLLASCSGGDPDPNPPPPTDSGTPVLAANPTQFVDNSTQGESFWPDGSGNGQSIDGVNCTNSEAYHIHGMVSIYRNGTRLALPADIGRNGCTYELHTHFRSGVVHVETNAQKTFTFGQLFEVWNQPLGTSNVGGIAGAAKFYLIENEKVTPVDHPEDVEITSHRELAIVIGTPPAALVRHRWPSDL